MKLYEHQKQALEQTKDRMRVAYFLDMGLGKTYVGAEKMREIGNPVNLLVCQKSKISDWWSHFSDLYDLDLYDLTDKKELECFLAMANSGHGAVTGIINYELAWRRKELLKLQDFTLVLDESSLIQNRKAKQSKFILKMKPSAVILLSGSPTGGKYENLWTQIHLLGWEISERLYNTQFVNWKTIQVSGMPIKTVDKENPYKNVERLKSKLRENGAVFMKTEEVMDMPDQNFISVPVRTSKEYKHFMKHGIVQIDGVDLVGDTLLTKRMRARQLCGQYSQAKIQAFQDLIESTNDRLIVFYNFTDEFNNLKTICEALNKPISIVNGETKDLTAYENEADSVTFVQYQAGAMGLNLQKSNKIIYFTLPERSELFEQSKKRIHRIGQEKPCFYYTLTCTTSIETLIYLTLQKRKDFTDELFRKIQQ